jgi:hypothetical protein
MSDSGMCHGCVRCHTPCGDEVLTNVLAHSMFLAEDCVPSPVSATQCSHVRLHVTRAYAFGWQHRVWVKYSLRHTHIGTVAGNLVGNVSFYAHTVSVPCVVATLRLDWNCCTPLVSRCLPGVSNIHSDRLMWHCWG